MAEEKKELSEEILNEVNGGTGSANANSANSVVQLTCPYCGNNGNHIRYSGSRVRCLNCGAVYVA